MGPFTISISYFFISKTKIASYGTIVYHKRLNFKGKNGYFLFFLLAANSAAAVKRTSVDELSAVSHES